MGQNTTPAYRTVPIGQLYKQALVISEVIFCTAFIISETTKDLNFML